MGRPTEKSLRRAESKREEEIQFELIKKAQAKDNPLDEIPSFKVFNKNGINADITYRAAQDVEPETMKWILDLERRNMEAIYNSCSWGWNARKKEVEMTESEARYLIATVAGEPVAFTHFRFDIDYGDAVVYCYELQLEEKVRRKGLGKFMMQILELLAFKSNLRKVILTVLNHNKPAVNFFYSLKYQRDETNLEENLFEEIPYEILSKANKKCTS